MLVQAPIELDLNNADIVIGEFSTCLLQAEDLGRTVITIENDLDYGVYSSYQTLLLAGYSSEDAKDAAAHIVSSIRNQYFASLDKEKEIP